MMLRVLVCIPVYNNEKSVETLITDAFKLTACGVVVVDDGSTQPVAEVLQNPVVTEALKSGRLTVLRHEKNEGKGRALQTAFRFALAKGYTHLISIDGENQHSVAESIKLLEAAVENPWDLIIGKRRSSTNDVPGASKFGRVFSNLRVRQPPGQAVQDSQSRYRLYPLFYVQNDRFFSKHHDFELEVLIKLLWRGVSVKEVEIEVYHPPKGQRVSYPNTFWNNVRISYLNAVLAVVSLLKFNRSPKKTALSFALGILIGASPLYGFHTLIAAAISFLFRLNFTLIFIGTQISLPPFALLLVPGEIAVGRAVLGHFGFALAPWSMNTNNFSEILQVAGEHLMEWSLGALILGLCLGTLGGLALGLMARKFSSQAKQIRTVKTRSGTLGNGILKWTVRNVGLRAGYAILFLIVPYFYLFAPTARKSAQEYWKTVKPEAGALQRRWLVMRQLFSFGQIMLDRAAQASSSKLNFRLTSKGSDEVLTTLEDKQALMIVTGHVGGWDLTSSLLSRERRAGEAMGDHATSDDVELVPFFGKLIPIDTKPFEMAYARQSLMILAFGFREGYMDYALYAFPVRQADWDANRAKSVQLYEASAAYAQALEVSVSKHPEQWFNFFPIFSRRPQAPLDQGAGEDQNSLWQEWPLSADDALAKI